MRQEIKKEGQQEEILDYKKHGKPFTEQGNSIGVDHSVTENNGTKKAEKKIRKGISMRKLIRW